jgi:hypothetical protein
MGLISKHIKKTEMIPSLPSEEQIIGKPIYQDPRPDLADDHHLWNELLLYALKFQPQDQQKSEEFCGVLHGLRCGGTRLRLGKNGWELMPDIDISGNVAWSNPAEYNQMKKQYLVPWSDWIAGALNQLNFKFPLE